MAARDSPCERRPPPPSLSTVHPPPWSSQTPQAPFGLAPESPDPYRQKHNISTGRQGDRGPQRPDLRRRPTDQDGRNGWVIVAEEEGGGSGRLGCLKPPDRSP